MDSIRLRQLTADLKADRENLDRIVDEAAACLNDLSGREPRHLEVRGAGDIVHDFYNAVEHFFERIAIELNGGLPAGPDSHVQLLRRMSREVESVRPAVIDDRLGEALHEYLRFRHLFRHGYGFSLDWAKIAPLLAQMQELVPELRRQFDDFVSMLQTLAARLEGEPT